MAVERASAGGSLIDVFDRVLDKGIVVDAWIRLSVVGIDLITVEARVVVASIETYCGTPAASRPPRRRVPAPGRSSRGGGPHEAGQFRRDPLLCPSAD